MSLSNLQSNKNTEDIKTIQKIDFKLISKHYFLQNKSYLLAEYSSPSDNIKYITFEFNNIEENIIPYINVFGIININQNSSIINVRTNYIWIKISENVFRLDISFSNNHPTSSAKNIWFYLKYLNTEDINTIEQTKI